MKISIDVDCTPTELRQFFGLPDLEPLHQEILTQMKRRAREGLSAEEISQMTRAWMTGAASGMEQFQELMNAALRSGSKGSKDQ